ncbi:hypothetical protein [Hymenobacter rigui]|uniref:Outer membrane protein beta-barrel domain-containing protein n=1 Tax=Hymenobacter rigui TaxID=334424 RepID=A0A3R9MKY5_9BACT|nr:hypothetical protein [Hymenobacter rigui]RSK48248.1 hypothetical protein EI291_10965 [Hymenobacter rigui]
MLSHLSFSGAAVLLLATAAQAQTSPVKPRLGLRPHYSLQAGATFAGRYGSATYLSPMVSVPVTQRFSVFGGVTYLRAMPGLAYAPFGEAGRSLPMATNHYLIQGGGQYALSPRVTLSGSAWKDLSPATGPLVSPYAGFGGNMGTGVNLRADYHITENFSVSGGVRVSNGATAYPGSYSPLFGPGSPIGY